MVYNEKAINAVKEILVSKKQTVAVAESVTSGHLQAAFSTATDASEFFQGGITAYNLGIKCRLLHVEPIHAIDTNCVSEKIAKEMALAANKIFLSDYALSITGYAAPMPEKGIHEMFAFFAIAFNDKIIDYKKINSNKKDSVDVQVDYATQVIAALLNVLKN